MHGLHLTADLHGCERESRALCDEHALRALAVAAVDASGLSRVGELFHPFGAPGGGAGGITGVVLLAESHLALHTWPELGAVTLDVYVCNHSADNSLRAERLLAALIEAFAPRDVMRQALKRGRLPGAPVAASQPSVKASSKTE